MNEIKELEVENVNTDGNINDSKLEKYNDNAAFIYQKILDGLEKLRMMDISENRYYFTISYGNPISCIFSAVNLFNSRYADGEVDNYYCQIDSLDINGYRIGIKDRNRYKVHLEKLIMKATDYLLYTKKRDIDIFIPFSYRIDIELALQKILDKYPKLNNDFRFDVTSVYPLEFKDNTKSSYRVCVYRK